MRVPEPIVDIAAQLHGLATELAHATMVVEQRRGELKIADDALKAAIAKAEQIEDKFNKRARSICGIAKEAVVKP